MAPPGTHCFFAAHAVIYHLLATIIDRTKGHTVTTKTELKDGGLAAQEPIAISAYINRSYRYLGEYLRRVRSQLIGIASKEA